MQAASTNNHTGSTFIELATVDSTNNYAMQLVNKGLAENRTVVFAHRQTAGKGQRGKQWVTAPGMNITMSLVLNVNYLQVSAQFLLSASVALAVYDFFDNYTKGDCSIKWPNDLYWRDRKAGGVLIENVIRGQEWQWAIVGIGINLNQSVFEDLINPVSLKQITGGDFDTIAMTKELCGFIDTRLHELKNGDPGVLTKAYNRHLYKIGELVRLKKNNITFDGLILGVTDFGQLIVHTGIEHRYNVGEVEWQF